MFDLVDNSIYCSPLNVLSLDALLNVNSEDDDDSKSYLEILDTSHNVEQDLARIELVDAVKRFLSKLGTRERKIVELKFWSGYSQADIARSENISRAAVTKALAKILCSAGTELQEFEHYFW